MSSNPMPGPTTESDWETFTLEWLAELGWPTAHGTDIAPGAENGRTRWDDLALPDRLLAALQRFNPEVPGIYLQQAVQEILTPQSNDAITENHRLHAYLAGGYRDVTFIDTDGSEVTPTIRLRQPGPGPERLARRQPGHHPPGRHDRRFDVVLYCNGMPVSIIELKKAGQRSADVAAAHAQLQTYLREFPMAFRFCVFTGRQRRHHRPYGTPFTPLNHFSPWNVDDDGRTHRARTRSARR